MRYVLYARKSSESEDRQVQSIDDQLRILRDFAAARSYAVAEEITESRSAKAPGDRPGFDRMMRLIESGAADAILCWSINRLTRNPIDAGKLSWLLQNRVLAAIHTPEKSYLPEDNVLLLSVETGMANQYILDLRKSVQRGIESKLMKGWNPHRAPEGYVNDLRAHTIVADTDGNRFLLLQRAWRLLLAGTHTVGRVVDLLNGEWGFRTKPTPKGGGKELSRTAAYDLFSNIFYAGYFRHGGSVYKGSHPPMVTLAEFEQVQRLLSAGSNRGRYKTHDFPYKGLIRCGRCGGAITGELQSGRHGKGNWVYYRCAKKTCSKGGCVREDVLEARLDACLARITISEEFRRIVTKVLEEWVRTEFGAQEDQYAQQMEVLSTSERMLDELLDLRLKGVIADAQYVSKKRDLEERVSQSRLAIGRSQERLDRTRATVEAALDFRLHARERFLTGNVEKRREIARALSARFVMDGREIFTEINPLLRFAAPSATLDEADEAHSDQSGAVLLSGQLEPLGTGSGSTRGTVSSEPVPLGWTTRTLSEHLSALFRAVAAQDVSFYWNGGTGVHGANGAAVRYRPIQMTE